MCPLFVIDNKRVLVTGGFGLIGTELVASLLKAGVNVIVLARLYRVIQHFCDSQFTIVRQGSYYRFFPRDRFVGVSLLCIYELISGNGGNPVQGFEPSVSAGRLIPTTS